METKPKETKKSKMKTVGYACLGYAFVLSNLLVLTVKVTSAEALPLIYFWTGTAITLLFGTAGKKIAGSAVMNKGGR